MQSYVTFLCPGWKQRREEEGKHLWIDRARTSFTSTLSHFSASLYLPISLFLPLLPSLQFGPSCPSTPRSSPSCLSYRNEKRHTTIQVRGQEKEQAALTMDQWCPLKQSFPFFPPLLFSHAARTCGTGKDTSLRRGGWGGDEVRGMAFVLDDSHRGTFLFISII